LTCIPFIAIKPSLTADLAGLSVGGAVTGILGGGTRTGIFTGGTNAITVIVGNNDDIEISIAIITHMIFVSRLIYFPAFSVLCSGKRPSQKNSS
jgi:hypothetical protein